MAAACSDFATVAKLDDGRLLGDVPLPALDEQVATVALHELYMLVLTVEGRVQVFGDPPFDRTLFEGRPYSSLRITALSAGLSLAAFLTEAGDVLCVQDDSQPFFLARGRECRAFIAVSCGTHHGCALRSDHFMEWFGSDEQGQRGWVSLSGSDADMVVSKLVACFHYTWTLYTDGRLFRLGRRTPEATLDAEQMTAQVADFCASDTLVLCNLRDGGVAAFGTLSEADRMMLALAGECGGKASFAVSSRRWCFMGPTRKHVFGVRDRDVDGGTMFRLTADSPRSFSLMPTGPSERHFCLQPPSERGCVSAFDNDLLVSAECGRDLETLHSTLHETWKVGGHVLRLWMPSGVEVPLGTCWISWDTPWTWPSVSF